MSQQPEVQKPAALRILTDSGNATLMVAGSYLAVASALQGFGWTPRGDLSPAQETASAAVAWAAGWLSPMGAAFVGALVWMGAALAFLLNRPHNLRWLAIALACLSVVGASPSTPWLDAAIVACCLIGWASQYLPQSYQANPRDTGC